MHLSYPNMKLVPILKAGGPGKFCSISHWCSWHGGTPEHLARWTRERAESPQWTPLSPRACMSPVDTVHRQGKASPPLLPGPSAAPEVGSLTQPLKIFSQVFPIEVLFFSLRLLKSSTFSCSDYKERTFSSEGLSLLKCNTTQWPEIEWARGWGQRGAGFKSQLLARHFLAL